MSHHPAVLRQLFGAIFLANLAAAVDAPVFDPGSSKASTQYHVRVTCPTPGAVIHYTMDGSIPDTSDPVVASGSFVVVQRTVTLNAVAWLEGVPSATTSANFMVVGQLSAGNHHGIALKSNRSLYSWGLNQFGSLGDGTAVSPKTSPGPVMKTSSAAFLDAIEADAGARHTLALVESGGILAFGLNTSGQLGNNSVTTPADYLPKWVLKGTTATDYLVNCFGVSASSDYSAALVGADVLNGTVYTWGGDINGRLGRIVSGTDNRYAKPVKKDVSPFPNLTGITQVATGVNHMLARTPHSSEQVGGAGNVWVWGLNSSGQLGLGNTTNYTRATQATALAGISDISAGTAHSVAVKWNALVPGRVNCFGQQEHGRLGNNKTVAAVVANPVAVQKAGGPLDLIVAVAAGPRHTLALDTSGKVWAWGDNGDGELGDNTLTARGLAAKVKDPTGTGDLSDIVNIAAGGPDGDGFSLASAADGTIYAWGSNAYGKLGIGNTTTPNKLPVVVGNLKLTNQGQPAVQISATLPNTYEPAQVTLNASISDPDGPNDIAKVDFFFGSTLLGTDTTEPYSCPWPDVPAGSHAVSAVATDLSGTVGTDAMVVVVRPVVGVTQIGSNIQEGASAVPGFRISRLTSNGNSLLVTFRVSGTAVNGVDYQTLPNAVEIPGAASHVDVLVSAKNDFLVEPLETIVLTIPDTEGHFPNPSAGAAGTGIEDVLRTDGDGLDASQEDLIGTSPVMDDTDGDGVNDGLDAFPLDPDRSDPPVPSPGDTTSPVVSVTTPEEAIQVSGP